MRDDYSLGRSSKFRKGTDKEEKKEAPVTNRKDDSKASTEHLGGFSGRVYDKLTYRTIEGALVTIAKDLSIETDEKGIFVVTGIKPGKYRITVFEEGYMARSCKSTAVAGETTKLDSFHLIPDCLIAEYPDEIVQEEETTEEEFVEFALETPQSTLSRDVTHAPEAKHVGKEAAAAQAATPDELNEQIEQAGCDSVLVGDTHGATTPDLEIRKGTIEEKAIEDLIKQPVSENTVPPGDAGGEVFPAFERLTEAAADAYIDIITAAIEEKKETSPDEIVAVLLEQIETTTTEDAAKVLEDFAEEPFIPEISLTLVGTVTTEVKRPEETPETVQEEVPREITMTVITEVDQPEETPETVQEEVPREMTMEEAPIEIAEILIQEEDRSVSSQEEAAELSAGETIQEAFLSPEQHEQSLATSSEIIPQTAVEQVVQPEEPSQAPAGESSRLGKLWKSLRNKIAKELELVQDEPTELSAEEVAEEISLVPEQKEQSSSPAEKTASGIEVRLMTSETPLEETQSNAAPLDKIEVSTTFDESAETIFETASSVNESPGESVETGIPDAALQEEVPQQLSGEEAPVEEIPAETVVEETVQVKTEEEIPREELLAFPIEVVPEIAAQEEITMEIYEEELLEPSVKISPEPVAGEEVLEEIHGEEQSVEVFLKEIPILALSADSTEAAMPLPEKSIIGDILFIDQFPRMFVEIDIAEMTQPEEALLEIPDMESPIETTTEEMTRGEIGEHVYRDQPLELSVEVAPEITAWEETLEEAHQETSLEPPVSIVFDLAAQEAIAEITQPEEVGHAAPREGLHDLPQDVSGETTGSKLVWWTRRRKKTNQADQEQFSGPAMGVSSKEVTQEKAVDAAIDNKTISTPDETIQTSKDRPDLAETVLSEQEVPRELSGEEIPVVEVVIETGVDKITEKKIRDGSHRKKLSGETSFEKAVDSPAADEDIVKTTTSPDNLEAAADIASTKGSVAGEEAPDGISDDDLASMSDEEKKAMSHGHDSIEVEGFIGIINAQPNPAYKGLPVSIAYTLQNIACDNPADFILRIIVLDPDTGAILETFETPVVCSKNSFSMGGFVIFTTTYETHIYRLNMQIVSKKTTTSHILVDIPLEIKAIY
jgi:hypothetical protein